MEAISIRELALLVVASGSVVNLVASKMRGGSMNLKLSLPKRRKKATKSKVKARVAALRKGPSLLMKRNFGSDETNSLGGFIETPAPWFPKKSRKQNKSVAGSSSQSSEQKAGRGRTNPLRRFQDKYSKVRNSKASR